MVLTRLGARLPALLALLLLPLVVLVGPAQAHASLVSSDPVADALYDVAPEAVTLRFSEPVGVDLGGVRVFGPDGQRVDGGTQSLEGGAVVTAAVDAGDGAAGTFTVAWSVVSADSHVLSGTFVYHVGARSGAVEVAGTDAVALTTARWLAR